MFCSLILLSAISIRTKLHKKAVKNSQKLILVSYFIERHHFDKRFTTNLLTHILWVTATLCFGLKLIIMNFEGHLSFFGLLSSISDRVLIYIHLQTNIQS